MTIPETATRFAELMAVIRGRRSVRAFLPDPVPTDAIRRAIDAAGWAPSPHGTQPWRFAVLESRASREKLADAMSTTWRAQLALDGQDEAIIARRLANSRDRLLTPPVVAILCLYLGNAHDYPDADRQASEELMAVQSLGAAAQNFLLALEAEGLNAGWMCAPLFVPELVRTTLGLPEGLIPHAMFPIGRMASPPKVRPRIAPEDLVAAWFADEDIPNP